MQISQQIPHLSRRHILLLRQRLRLLPQGQKQKANTQTTPKPNMPSYAQKFLLMCLLLPLRALMYLLMPIIYVQELSKDDVAVKAVFEYCRNLLVVLGLAAASDWLWHHAKDAHTPMRYAGAISLGFVSVMLGLLLQRSAQRRLQGYANIPRWAIDVGVIAQSVFLLYAFGEYLISK
ncbi:hypothetical protein AB4851_22565 [Burkholderia sp. 22PA0099]|uniref:hypothetical protein n=1 Tax=Burkholderia sp. 22PA0099 TaxID=3237372 RepID=UPI0039C1489F